MGGVLQSILVLLTISCIVETCLGINGTQPKAPEGSCDCGKKNPQISPRIIGGSETEVNEYPWMAHLYFKMGGEYYHCGGSIINDRFILTAAHCVGGRNAKDFVIHFGAHNTSDLLGSGAQMYYIQAIIIHKDFDHPNYRNDIALIQTTKKIEFSVIIGPICLPKPSEDFSGQMATVIGWGMTGESEGFSDVLKKVKVKVISDKECKSESNKKIRDFPKIICTTGNEEGTCIGDSGGPLMVQNTLGDYEQIGVVSFTYGCSTFGYPDGYTRVAEYLDWIRTYTEYCCKRTRIVKD